MERLIGKYLNGDLSLDEQRELSKWIQDNDRNREVFDKIKAYWTHHKSDLEKEELEVRLRLLRMMRQEESRAIEKRKKSTPVYMKLMAGLAAACMIFFGIYWYQISQSFGQDEGLEITSIEKVSLLGQKITTTLPDGTKVKLNSGSKIIVPERFTGETREVTLYGEAFFNVAENKSKPFIIHTGDIQVKVLGTSFNVKSYPNGEATEIAVASGKVAISDKGNQKKDLMPGEKLSYLKKLQLMSIEKFDWEEEYGWKENILLFKGDTFSKIKERLSKWYDVDFIIEGDTINLNKKFTGRYTEPSLKEVLEGLSYVYEFDYQIEKKTVTLKANKK